MKIQYKNFTFPFFTENPDMFLGAVVILTMSWYSFFADSFPALKWSTVFIFTCFFFCFTITYRSLKLFIGKLGEVKIKRFIPKTFLYKISILLFIFTVLKLLYLIQTIGASSMLEYRNSVAGVSDGKVKSIKVGISFPFIMASYYVAKQEMDLKYIKIFFWAAVTLAIISTAKIFILLLMFYTLSINSFKLGLKQILIILLSGFLFFSLSSIILGKFSSNGEGNFLRALLETFNVYYIGGIAALQKVLGGTSPNIEGWIRIGSWNTNVFTAFYTWKILFGDLFYLKAGVLLGAWYSIFSNKKNQFFCFYKIFLIFPLFMIIFTEQYIAGFKMHFMFFLCSIIVGSTKLKKYVIFVNK